MCGFAGIVALQDGPDEVRQAAEAMQRALRHRGPDDQGIFLCKHAPAALVHTRLSILDLSPAGHQPMATPDGRYWIAFNGEIYNFRKIRQDLERRNGVVFRTGSDTEVVLQLYVHEGASGLERLRGMFAFAIWDEVERTCFLARDPLGIKPLYYYQDGQRLIFASELRALLASDFVPRRLCLPGLTSFLLRGHVLEPLTMVQGVRSLPAGCKMTWQDGVLRQRRYWRLEDLVDRRARGVLPTSTATDLSEALNDSVRHHFESDVPVGIFLSGGLDSSSILSLARRHVPGELHTYSIGFEERQYDESTTARRVAMHYDAKHHEWKMTARDGHELFRSYLNALDQPSVDGFNTYCVSHFARESGTKVVLSGLGGDELFGSYPSFSGVPRLMTLGRILSLAPAARHAASDLLRAQNVRSSYRRIGDFLNSPPNLRSAYRCYRGLFQESDVARILRTYWPGFNGPVEEGHAELPESLSQLDPREAVSYFELTHYMRSQLLRDSDSMSMAHGLELRVPFVDAPLVEKVMGLPPSLRFQAQKQALTDAVGDLPSWLLTEPKRGFSFPLESWIPGEWKEEFNEVRRTYGAHMPLASWGQTFSLFVLGSWAEKHLGMTPRLEELLEPAALPEGLLSPSDRSND